MVTSVMMISLLFAFSFVLYVDGVDLNQFYPYGESVGDSALIPNDDGSTTDISLTVPFPFFDRDHSTIFINNNGIISFTDSIGTYTPDPFPLAGNTELIAPFWADVDTRGTGRVYYRETAELQLLEKAGSDIRSSFVDHSEFHPSFLIIATWDHVGYYEEKVDKTNTFQCILATDGKVSFVMFLYADGLIQWTTGEASGGTAAQVGFNAGDGTRFSIVPSSRTDAVINITQSSNVGVPGMWVYQVDEDIRGGGCTEKSSEVLPLDITPRYGNVLGGETIKIAGPCFEEGDEITCMFNGEETFGLYLSKLEALCVVPLLGNTVGQITLEVFLKGALKGRATFTTLSIPRGHKADILTDSLLLDAEESLELSWEPNAIFPPLSSTDYKIDVLLYSYSVTEEAWKKQTSLAEDVENSGAVTVQLPTSLQATGGNSNPIPIAIQLFVTHSTALTDLHQDLISADLQAGLWTSLYYYGTLQLQTLGFLICTPWHLNEPPDIDQTLLNRVGACPPTEDRAMLPNSGVKPERFTSFFGNTNYEDQQMNFFHPGASSCFVQQASPSETEGSLLQCCYDNSNNLIVESPAGGTVKLVSEETSFTQNLVSDVFPFIQCCCQTSFPQCTKYYERRPSDDGSEFNPPPPAWMFGEPHLVTLDGLKYTFNGHGEYVLIETDGNRFSLMARMLAATNSDGNASAATVISAVAAREGDSDVVQLSYSSRRRVDALINGERIRLEEVPQNFELVFNGVIINKHDNRTVSVSFSSGTTIQVTEDSGFLSVLTVSLHESYRGLTAGLLGNYNGDPTDDLVARMEMTPISTESSVNDIHEKFGSTWATIQPSESLLTYEAGETWQTVHDESLTFTPTYEIVFGSPEDEQIAISLCNGEEACLFDIAATGRTEVGLSTLAASQEVVLVAHLSLPVLCDPPCENGACVATNTCSCASGYEGETCSEIVYSECENATVCGGGAKCRSHAGTYICSCPSERATENCSSEYNEDSRSNNYVVVNAAITTVGITLLVAMALIFAVVLYACRRRYRGGRKREKQKDSRSGSSLSDCELRNSCILGESTILPSSTEHLFKAEEGKFPPATTFEKHTNV